ncbi:MAG: DUF3147 family protein [bacterium]|nr:DUF3147 family protein [bacterium]
MNILTIQLIISFFIGGLFIALQTLIAEHVPLRWRGIILSIPSTSALGFFFIGLTKTAVDAADAVRIFPAAIGVTYLFVLIFTLLVIRSDLLHSFIGAFIVWAIAAYTLLRFPPTTFTISILYSLPVIIISYAIIRKLPHITTFTPVPINGKNIVIRSLIAGSIIVLVIILSKKIGNIWGGMFSAFPAVYTSTFLIYVLAHGRTIVPSVARSLFFPGTLGFIIYGWLVIFTFPIWGIWIGTLTAYMGTSIFYALYNIAAKRLQRL